MPADVQALNEHLMPALAYMRQIAGAVMADDAGREYFLRLDDGRWITRERLSTSDAATGNAAASGISERISEWRNDDDRISSQQQPSTHDPRQRPWFQAAVQQLQGDGAEDAEIGELGEPGEAGEDKEPAKAVKAAEAAESSSRQDQRAFLSAPVTWSLPYQFISLDEPGITVATAWRQHGELLVLALDVTLARILATIDRLHADTAGYGFLFDREGGVYVSSPSFASSPQYQNGTLVSGNSNPTQPEEHLGVGVAASGFDKVEQRLGSATTFAAIAAWRAAGEPEDRPVRFESGGRHWWAGFVPLEPVKRKAWVGVAYPSAGPLGLLQQRWPLFAGSALAILALGIGLALLVVRRYSHQLRELPKLSIDSSQPDTELYDLIGRGESAHLEFKSTMRLNLRSGKNDKAIELAWLKGVAAFLNSEGGILLLGVADDGEVLGLAGDGFANDDKCLLHFKNLVNQHLGAEAMRHLRFRLFALGDKQIGAIECEPAETPVYLRPGNGESFLIRTGPSNSELPISRALSYIESRF
ncbi:MAG: ATP-binding protein [Chromatiaceae bacterium]|nr:ATP-binding protein [Chromatiaceae bacterium]